MRRIGLSELFAYLGYTDIRTVRKWCNNNNVAIIRQGKSEFVYEANFRQVFDRPLINKLREQHGDNWQEVYQLYLDGNIPALTAINSRSKYQDKSYKPDNEIVSKYLSKYENGNKSNPTGKRSA